MQQNGVSADFPSKPITLVATGGGGSHDYATRFIAPALAKALGQPVEVNYQDESGSDQAEIITKAPPDGHTLLVSGRTHWLIPMLRQDARYDVLRDFAPVSQITRGCEVLVVHPDMPVKTAGDIVELARKNPGGLKYASNADGGNNHLAAELFKIKANVDIKRIRCKNSAERFAKLQAREVDMFFTGICSFADQLRDGTLKPLGVTSSTRSPVAPNLPTIAESGVPGYENVTIGAIFAAAATPEPTLRRLNEVIAKIMQSPEARAYFLKDGYEPVGSSREELLNIIVEDTKRVEGLMKGLRLATGAFT
jgi:tripartite-type tricarboxylate transporter receptor subunit TctC